MRFMMFMIPAVYQGGKDKRVGADFTPSAIDVEPMMKYNEELAKAGALIALDSLHPIEKGARVSFFGGKATVTDGPFAETKEQLGGMMVLEARDLNHAIQLMSDHPSTRMRGTWEIRPADEQINAFYQEKEK